MANLRILLAEDDSELRVELAALLEASGIRVVGQAGSGGELLALVEGRACDAILTDLTMPGIDGLRVLALLGRRASSPPVVVLSVHDDIEHVDRALQLGASGYLLKSARTGHIVEALTTAVAGGAYIHPSVARAVIDRHLRLVSGAAGVRSSVSPRQRELLQALAHGLGNKEIAHRLGLREDTVKSYLSELYTRIGAHGRAPAVAWALRHRLID